jgi:hypothetical protein
VHIKPQITCPKVLVLRHLIQYEPSDSTHRQTISAAFQQYGDYVTKLQLQADGCLPQESRDTEEVERANRLASKVIERSRFRCLTNLCVPKPTTTSITQRRPTEVNRLLPTWITVP